MPMQQRNPDDKPRNNLTAALIGGVISGVVRAVTDRLIQLIDSAGN
ncbi:hypothetical protein [Micromonospora sp. NPDC126480]